MFLDCPAHLDEEGALRCGLLAEIRCRFTMRSTDGPLESAMIRCPAGCWFNGPIESLTWEREDKHAPGTAGVTPTLGVTAARTHDGKDSGGGFAIRAFSAGPRRGISPEHRSCLLSGPTRAPVDYRHAPPPQPHRIQSPDGSCHGGYNERYPGAAARQPAADAAGRPPLTLA